MLRLPGNLSAQKFLAFHWQKKPLFMPRACSRIQPSVTRNELAWLATLEDVESRIVFTDRSDGRQRYRVDTGPFDEAFLSSLPRHDWTLLVHDVDKHLPALRKLFDLVPFIPDWRIDDLMVSFAAPGGGVGPHRDNYDVFLCQGIGVRDWKYTTAAVDADEDASEDLALVEEFSGNHQVCVEGDVLYLPPGAAHWGTAKRSCMTYSIGMRAPQYYRDPDLAVTEARPGYISPAALERAGEQSSELGQTVTGLKNWLHPDLPDGEAVKQLLAKPTLLGRPRLHGMARLAYDDSHVYLNGRVRELASAERSTIAELCCSRSLRSATIVALDPELLTWLITNGAFEVPENA